MTLLATWPFGMAALPAEVLVWPRGVDVALLALTIGLFASLAALVVAREDGRSLPRRTRVRLEGVHTADEQLPSAA